jgi:hypothetical protein
MSAYKLYFFNSLLLILKFKATNNHLFYQIWVLFLETGRAARKKSPDVRRGFVSLFSHQLQLFKN